MDDDFTVLIRRVNALFGFAYGELRKLARSRFSRGGSNTILDASALVHESYLRYL